MLKVLKDYSNSGLLFLQGLIKFSDVQLQSIYFSADAGSLHHHPSVNAYEAKPMATTDNNGSTHNLVSGLVGPEEFDGTKNNRNQTDEIAYKNIEHNQTHSFAVEVS